jgi:hypothetical protein
MFYVVRGVEVKIKKIYSLFKNLPYFYVSVKIRKIISGTIEKCRILYGKKKQKGKRDRRVYFLSKF